MVSTCPNCGVATPPEARFCRHCGAPLRTGATLGGSETVSPLAQTVPLSSEGLTTSSLGTDDSGRPAPETKRVRQTEIEHLFRHTRLEAAPDSTKNVDGGAAADSDYAAPQTGELVQGTRVPVVAVSAPAPSGGRAAHGPRSRRSWLALTSLLLLATISGAFLAYYLLRQRSTQSAGETAAASNSNQSAEQMAGPTAETTNVNSSVVEAEAGESTPPQPEERPAPTVKPSASVEPTRDERAKQERERQTEAPVPASTPTPVPAPSPAAQAQPTPAPSPAGSNNNSTTPPPATSDAFYFQAVNIVNGREPRSMKRAELLRALQLFQNVTSGPHVAEARRQATRLSRELDRLDKQSQR